MSDQLANSLSAASAGFSSADSYKRKREELEREQALAQLRGGSAAAAPPAAAPPPKEKKKKKKEKARPGALSFEDDLDGEAELSPSIEKKKMGKCQDVDVSFLKKSAQEEEAAAQKQEAAVRDYLALQAQAREEPVTLSYVFRSENTQRELPSGVHRATVTVKMGDAAEEVARAVRLDTEKLGGKFEAIQVAGVREERDCILVLCVPNKEHGSFVIPPTSTLVELRQCKWTEGHSLFDDFKPGVVVVERRWYEQNRHQFPYSQWSPFEMKGRYSHKEFVANRLAVSGVTPEYKDDKGNVISVRSGR